MPPLTSNAGLGETLDNQRIMKLVEEVLRQPEQERQRYLERECGSNASEYQQAWHYVEWEQRMQGFLLDPVIKRDESEGLKIAPGDVLQSRFSIVREIAQGGMGVVYEAMDEKLGRRIALKCAKAGFGKELPPEVRHATEVSHPNVCKIHEIHTTTIKQQMVDFITMEYLDGETLAHHLAHRGRIPPQQSKEIARQIAAGLAAAHQNGVIHGDIKTNNIILAKTNSGDMRAVITDFGLARTEQTASRGVWGTPGYMAPELWLGQQPSVASDIYALGIVFYEMATGQLPDRSQVPQAKSETLKATPFLEVARQKPPSVNGYWDRILARCLDPDPKKRYTDANQLVTALAPTHFIRNALLAAAVAGAIALTGFVTYKAATAPSETIKLAIVNAGSAPVSDVESTVSQLEGTRKISFTLLRSSQANQATHLLKLTTAPHGTQTELHATLSDLATQSILKSWDALYTPAEWKYAPSGVAGFVSSALHLTPLPASLAINNQAEPPYRAGVHAMRQEWTLSDAAQDLAQARAADPDSALVWAATAQVAFERSDQGQNAAFLAEAREDLREAELRSQDTTLGHRVATELDTIDNHFEDAEAHSLRAIEIEPGNSENYRLLGAVYNRLNQFDPALRALRRAVDLEPRYYKNQLDLGVFYSDQGRFKEAVEHLSDAVRLAPSVADARFDLAEAYTDTGQFDKALENLDALKNWGPKEHFQLGTILMYQSRNTEAVPHLMTAVEQQPHESIFWEQLSIAQRLAGQLADSKASVKRGLLEAEKIVNRNPKRSEARALLGYFCAQLGETDRAASETEQALNGARHQNDVIWLAVATYEKLGRRTDALEVLRAAPSEMREDLKRWPDLADFCADSRFIKLTAEHAAK